MGGLFIPWRSTCSSRGFRTRSRSSIGVGISHNPRQNLFLLGMLVTPQPRCRCSPWNAAFFSARVEHLLQRCTAFTAQSTIMRRLRSKILQQPSCSDPFQAGLSSGWRSFRGFAAEIARMQQLQQRRAVPAPLFFLGMRSRHLRVVGNPALRYGAHSIYLHGKSNQAAAKSEAPRRKSL